MKQSSKKTNQSAKILKIYAECRLHKNTLNHTKERIAWFSWVFKEIQNEWDEGERIAQLFLYWFTQSQSYIQFTRQLEPGFHYIQKFYKLHTKIILLNKETQKTFYSHKNLDTHPARIIVIDLKSHQAPTGGTRTSKLDGGCP